MTETMRRVDAPGHRSGRRAAVSLMLIALMAVAAAVRLAPSPVRAATTEVTIKDFSFKPQDTKVKAGDTVTWANKETNNQTHTVIQDDGAFSSDGNRPNDPNREIKPGASYSHSFETDNVTYPFHCRLHSYMTGRVIVGKGSPAGAPPPPPATEEPAPSPTPNSGPLPPLPLPSPLGGRSPETGLAVPAPAATGPRSTSSHT